MDKITFAVSDTETVDFFVLEQTRLGGTDYILVIDRVDGRGEALILKDLSKPEDKESVYEIVSDDTELDAVAAVFEKMMDDIAFVSEEKE